MSYDPAVPMLGIHPKETRIERETCIPMSIAALFTIARTNVAQLIKNPPAVQETLVLFFGWEIPWRRDGLPSPVFLGFLGGSAGKESACNARDLFDPWVGKMPWRRKRLPTPVFWPGEFHGLYSPWDHKESDTTE